MGDDESLSTRTVVIVQPCFFPWRGQFDLFSRGDINIFLDDVQFSRGSWYNRNKIMTTNGPAWISVPVQKKGFFKCPIKDTPISYRDKWQDKILGQLHSSYRKAPHFNIYYPAIEELIKQDWTYVSELSIASVRWGFEQLARPTSFLLSSELAVTASDPVQRIIELCSKVGGDRYLSGPSAQSYIGNGAAFQEAGIQLEWMQYPQYPCYHEEDVEEMSIIDLLFRVGPEAPRYIWKDEK